MMITGAGTAGQFVQDQINMALNYINSQWGSDVLNLSTTESFITSDAGAMANLPDCAKDLADINKTAGTNITFQNISDMAASVDIENAFTTYLPNITIDGVTGPKARHGFVWRPEHMHIRSVAPILNIGCLARLPGL